MSYRSLLATASVTATVSLMAAAPAQAVFFHIGSGSIDGSLCVGLDCVASPAFGFDTIRMSENNLRVHFEDTSTAAAFPPNDWRIIINDSANGGASYFGVEDSSAGRIPFRVSAGARSNALFVDSQGDVGIGTSTPATDIEIKIGDTPTVRLQQDGTSGFTPQTWDMAGNETNFFIRDVTGGSTLPFRIRPGAPSSAIFIDTDGDVGIGTASPNTSNADDDLVVLDSGPARLALINTAAANTVWTFNSNNTLRISAGADAAELTLDGAGNMTLEGTLVTGGGGTCDPGPCDGVFDPSIYEVESIEEHAAFMWDNKYLWGVGPTPEGAPINLSQKTTGILHELEKAHIYIEQLNGRIAMLEARIGIVKPD